MVVCVKLGGYGCLLDRKRIFCFLLGGEDFSDCNFSY